MKFIPIVLICLFATATLAQVNTQVPPDVTYKPASAAENAAAKEALQKALADEKSVTTQFFATSVTCGPMLWRALKPTADKKLVDAKAVTAMLGTSKPVLVEGRSFGTVAEQKTFWAELLKQYPSLANGRIRTPTAWEISYFWATIPFDIQEPFFAIDAGPDVFIANFRQFDNKPVLLWFDLVGDFQHLQPQ